MPENTSLPIATKIVPGIAIVVLASLIIWLCASVHSADIRLAVLENQFETTNCLLSELRVDSKANFQILTEIKAKMITQMDDKETWKPK